MNNILKTLIFIGCTAAAPIVNAQSESSSSVTVITADRDGQSVTEVMPDDFFGGMFAPPIGHELKRAVVLYSPSAAPNDDGHRIVIRSLTSYPDTLMTFSENVPVTARLISRIMNHGFFIVRTKDGAFTYVPGNTIASISFGD